LAIQIKQVYNGRDWLILYGIKSRHYIILEVEFPACGKGNENSEFSLEIGEAAFIDYFPNLFTSLHPFVSLREIIKNNEGYKRFFQASLFQ